MKNQEELLQLFSAESIEHLDALEPALLALEKDNKDADEINRIFRAVHSIKGSSGFFGLQTITDLSHVMENLMALVRDGDHVIDPAGINAMLKGVDKLRSIIEDLQNWDKYDISEEVELVKQHLGQPKSNKKKVKFPHKLFDPEPYLFKEFTESNHNMFVIELWLKKDIEDKELNILEFLNEIEPLGVFIDSAIDTSKIKRFSKNSPTELKYSLLMSTHMESNMVVGALEVSPEQIQQLSSEKIKKWLDSKDLSKKKNKTDPNKLFEPISTEEITKLTPEAKGKAVKTDSVKGNETIRISISLLDELMNLTGEMVLSRNQLVRLEGKESQDTKLSNITHTIDSITTRFQEKVMQARLQPVTTIFNKFNRIVRDLSIELKKDIDLKVESNDVELDKSIIEGLSDPLTHLIRNCVDHAIETPEERTAIGKKSKGLIRLSAKHVGSQVLIDVIDDGRGIDPEIIKHSAIKKELITAESAKKLSSKQLINLIFEPGFSTAKKVSNVSGRGVGMDVVRTNIEKLGGSVELESTKDKGTRFSLCLPLTLAIIPSVIVESDNSALAIPQANIAEIVKVKDAQSIGQIKDQKVLKLRDKLLPLVDLKNILFGEPKDLNEDFYIVVATVDSNKFGIIIDCIKDNEEIVVKPLSRYLKNLDLYSGSTIMGDGQIAMILNVTGIYHRSIKLAESETTQGDSISRGDIPDSELKHEAQTLLLFRNHPDSLFALNLAMVTRLEKVKKSDIEMVGDYEFYKRNGEALKLIRMEDYMPVSKVKELPEEFYVIIPGLVKYPMGIIVTDIVDIFEEKYFELDEQTVTGTGILGSGIIRDKLVVHVNLYSLFESVDPELYAWDKQEFSNKLRGKNVLFAEDTPFFRSVISSYLKESSCNVDVVNDGQEAWEKINSNSNYDLVITDIEMPRMNGFELTKKIRANSNYSNLPVIALTSLSSLEKKDYGQQVGFSAYEVKIDKEKLRTTIERFL